VHKWDCSLQRERIFVYLGQLYAVADLEAKAKKPVKGKIMMSDFQSQTYLSLA